MRSCCEGSSVCTQPYMSKMLYTILATQQLGTGPASYHAAGDDNRKPTLTVFYVT